jgi:hypothetical protein
MRFFNACAWIFTIVGVALIAAHWTQIRWYLANKATVDQAADTADALKAAGVLK